MEQRTKNILEELENFVPQRDKHQIVESRANNLITGVINLLNSIRESFELEEAEELSKRLLNAIKNEDPEKFTRKIREYRKIQEQRKRNGNKS